DQLVPLLARQYPGRGPGAQFSRGRAARSPGADVRRAGSARHHARGQHPRGGHHGTLCAARARAMIDQGLAAAARAVVPAARLERSPSGRRALKSLLLTIGTWVTAIIAGIPLVSVLYMLIVRGGSRLAWSAFVELPPAGFETGGGFGNAIAGT